MAQIMILGCKNFNNESIGSTIPSQSNNSTYMGLKFGNLAFEKLESTINVDNQFSFRNVHKKTVSVPLGTHKLDKKEMTTTCHVRLLHKQYHAFSCFSQVYSFNSVIEITWDSYTLLQLMFEHFPTCVSLCQAFKFSKKPIKFLVDRMSRHLGFEC